MDLLDPCTRKLINSDSGTICVRSTSKKRVFVCTVRNIEYGASNITWIFGDKEVNNVSVIIDNVTQLGTSGLVNMTSSLDVSPWAMENLDRVINLTCQATGNEDVDPVNVTVRLRFYYGNKQSPP